MARHGLSTRLRGVWAVKRTFSPADAFLMGRASRSGRCVKWFARRARATTRRTAIKALLEGEADAAGVAERLSRALGPGNQGRSDAAEIFWAARRLLETLARPRPLLVVFEDLHWAEPTFLDLVESLAVQPGRSALVLVCIARPELLEQRPAWAAGAARAVSDRSHATRRRLSRHVAGRAAKEISASHRSFGHESLRQLPAIRSTLSNWRSHSASRTGARPDRCCHLPSRLCWRRACSASGREQAVSSPARPSSARTSECRQCENCSRRRRAARSAVISKP